MSGSANIGRKYAMFEAIHGSAPDIAGTNQANPSGLLNAAIMMLQYIGQYNTAQQITDAWLTTLKNGFHTKDIFNAEKSKQLVSTEEFGEKIIQYLKDSKTVEKQSHIVMPEFALKYKEPNIVGWDIYILQIDNFDQIKDIADRTKTTIEFFAEKGHIIQQPMDDLVQVRFKKNSNSNNIILEIQQQLMNRYTIAMIIAIMET